MSEFLISRIKDYIPLSDSEIRDVESLFVEEHFKKNEVLLQGWCNCRKLFFKASDLVRFSRMVDGEDRTYVFRAEGCFCNALESFLKKYLPEIPSQPLNQLKFFQFPTPTYRYFITTCNTAKGLAGWPLSKYS